MYKEFPINPVLYYMVNNGDKLKIAFRTKNKVQERLYINVSMEVISKLFYLNSAKDCLSFYSLNIKGKYTVSQVINK